MSLTHSSAYVLAFFPAYLLSSISCDVLPGISSGMWLHKGLGSAIRVSLIRLLFLPYGKCRFGCCYFGFEKRPCRARRGKLDQFASETETFFYDTFVITSSKIFEGVRFHCKDFNVALWHHLRTMKHFIDGGKKQMGCICFRTCGQTLPTWQVDGGGSSNHVLWFSDLAHDWWSTWNAFHIYFIEWYWDPCSQIAKLYIHCDICGYQSNTPPIWIR